MLVTYRLVLAVAVVSLATVAASCGQSEVADQESTTSAASDVLGDATPTGRAEAEAPPADSAEAEPLRDELRTVVFADYASTTPSESLTDWVDLALFAAVIEIEAESVDDPATVLPPSEPLGMAASIGNTYQGTVVEVVWQDEDGALRAGDRLEFAGAGWLAMKDEEGFDLRPFFPYLEVGKRYLIALAQHFEGVAPLGETAVVPISDNGVVEDWNVADSDGNPRRQPGVAMGLAAGGQLETTQDFAAALDQLPVPIDIRRASPSAIDRHLAIIEQEDGRE